MTAGRHRVAATYRSTAGTLTEGVVVADVDGVRLLPGSTAGLPRLDGVVTGGFTDHHVHLQLVDTTALADGTLGRVVDLGAGLDALSSAVRRPATLHNSCDSSGSRHPAPGNTAPAGRAAGISPELCTSGGDEESADAAHRLHSTGQRDGGGHGTGLHGTGLHGTGLHGVQVAFAGPFLTPPGGYPSDRPWAPAGSVREIPDAEAAERAIAEAVAAGATCIKVMNNSAAGPVFADGLFRRIVEIAAAHAVPVVAHAEGPGQVQRAGRLGAEALAHAPFTERLTDAEIAEQAGSVAWISTLAIHDGDARAIAVDNVRRFHAAGGVVRYGTDMGNGPTPVDLNRGEIAALRTAGLSDADLWRALDPLDPLDPTARLLLLPAGSPADADPLLARPLTAAHLES